MPWGGRRRGRRRRLAAAPLVLLAASLGGPRPASAFFGFGQRPGAGGSGGGSTGVPCLVVAPTAQQPQPPQPPNKQPPSQPTTTTTALPVHAPHQQPQPDAPDGGSSSSHIPAGPPAGRHHHGRPPPTGGSAPSTTERHLNHALGSLPPDSDAEAVLALVAREVAFFNAVNCATALNRLSRAAFRSRVPARKIAGDRRFAALLAQTGRRLAESGPAQQNQYMSAFARLGVLPPQQLLAALLTRIEADVGAYKAVELAGLLNAMAKLSTSNPVACPPSAQQPPPPHWPRPLLRRLAAQAAVAVARGEGTGEMACNTYCSLAKLGFSPGAELTGRLAGRLLELELATLDAHWLAQTLNAMARHGLDPGADFMLAARDEVLLRLNRQQLPPLDLAMCVSALGKLRPHPGPFFHRTLLRYTGKHLEAMGAAGPQALSLLVGGLGNLQATQQQAAAVSEDEEGLQAATVAAPELISGLLRLLDARVEELKPQELANALAGLGKLRARPDAAFLARAAAAVERRLLIVSEGPAGFAASDLASVAFGLRRMRFAPSPDFVAAARAWGLRVLGRVEARAVGGPEGVNNDMAPADARDVGHALNALVRVGAATAAGPDAGGKGGMEEVLQRAAAVLVEGDLLAAAPLQSLAMAVGAFARFDVHPGAAFLDAAARAGLGPEEAEEGEGEGAMLPAEGGSALHTALLLQALARLGHEPTPAQLDRALARLAPRLQELTPKCLFHTLYALAKWDLPASAEAEAGGRRAFLQAWSAQAPKRGLLAALTTPQLVVAAWALRALGYRATPDARRAFRETLGARALVALTDTEAASLLHSLRGIGLDVEADCPPLLLLRGERALLAAAAGAAATTRAGAMEGGGAGGSGAGSGVGGGMSGGGALPLHLLPADFLAAPTVLALKRGAAQRRAMVTPPIFPSGPETTDEGPPVPLKSTSKAAGAGQQPRRAQRGRGRRRRGGPGGDDEEEGEGEGGAQEQQAEH